MNAVAILKPMSILTLTVMIFSGTQVFAQEEDQEMSGRNVYTVFCAICHGPQGLGSPLGKTLTAGDALVLNDQQIIEVISKGRPDTGMNGFGTGLSRAEIEGVTQFIRQLQGRAEKRKARTTTSGSGGSSANNAAQARVGEKLFNGKAGCMQCHSYYTRGGTIGPALDTLGTRFSAQDIRNAVELPSATITEPYGGKEIVTQGGNTIIGRFRYETEDTVQLLNVRGDLWTTYFKADLRSVSNSGKSLMPEGLLSRLAKDEQDALLAFLQTLK